MQRRRRPAARDRRYLAALIEWGYQPSDVERLVLTPPAEASTSGAAEVEGSEVDEVDEGSEVEQRPDAEENPGPGYVADEQVSGGGGAE